MRNRISCSAQTLTQLQPDMIRSVVGGQVFGLGNQYFTENRVHILEVDSGLVSAEVSGTFGVYSQTIKLRSGVLATKCSCPSNEKPFCRHCVAVLLQHYEDTANEKKPQYEHDQPEQPDGQPGPVADSDPGDFNFRDVTIFVDWIQAAVARLGSPEALPSLPKLPGGAVRGWGEAIDSLHRQFLKTDEIRKEAQTSLESAQEQIVGLTQDLEDARRDAKDAHGACVGLQTEIKKYQESLAEFDRVREEKDRLDRLIKETRHALQRKGSELSGLSEALNHLSNGLE